MNRLVAVVLAACSSPSVDSGSPPATAPSCEEGFDPGDCPPDFALPTADGDLARLSDQLGKVVLVDQSAIW